MRSDDRNPLANAERLAALRATGLLDSEPEPPFDQVTRMIVSLLHAANAHVSLVDDHRQFLKSSYNLDNGAEPETSEQALSGSFCQFAVISREPFIVEDAKAHPLVRENEAIDRGVISYAGVPLITEQGHVIGAICATDNKPRTWSQSDIESLQVLARSTMSIIEPRINEQTRAARAASTWGDVDPWMTRLLDLTEQHLAEADGYQRLLRFADSIRQNDETRARQNVVRGLKDLRVHHEARTIDILPRPQEQFARSVRDYLNADATRHATLAAFTNREVPLSAVEIANAEVNEAEDALRLAVRQLGIDP